MTRFANGEPEQLLLMLAHLSCINVQQEVANTEDANIADFRFSRKRHRKLENKALGWAPRA
jgi:hypothetical protein